MPNRILKESITTSDTIDALSAEEERFFCRLLVVADDFGRADARTAVLRAKCFPLKVDLELAPVEAWLSAICRAGLARTYHADGRRYLQIVTWRDHQNVRAKASKFPEPVTFDDEPQASVGGVIASASKCEQTSTACEQTSADAPVLVSRSSDLGSRISDLDPVDADAPTVAGSLNQGNPAKPTPPAGRLFESTPTPSKAEAMEAAITEVLEHWRVAVERPKWSITGPASKERRKRVRARLAEGLTVADLKLAASHARNDANLWGTKPDSPKGGHRDVMTVFRDAAMVERLRDLDEPPGSARPTERSGWQPDSSEVLKREPEPPPTPEETRAAAAARERLSRMTTSLADRKAMQPSPDHSPEAIQARRELLRQQAQEGAEASS